MQFVMLYNLFFLKNLIFIITIIIVIFNPMSITPISAKEKTNKNIQISFLQNPKK